MVADRVAAARKICDLLRRHGSRFLLRQVRRMLADIDARIVEVTSFLRTTLHKLGNHEKNAACSERLEDWRCDGIVIQSSIIEGEQKRWLATSGSLWLRAIPLPQAGKGGKVDQPEMTRRPLQLLAEPSLSALRSLVHLDHQHSGRFLTV